MAAHVKIGDICYDKVNKEYVLITNRGCVKDHSTPEAFKESHGPNGLGECEYEASECAAIRVVGMNNGRAITGWTYRGCQEKNLVVTTDITRDQFEKMMTGGKQRRTPYNIGRV